MTVKGKLSVPVVYQDAIHLVKRSHSPQRVVRIFVLHILHHSISYRVDRLVPDEEVAVL